MTKKARKQSRCGAPHDETRDAAVKSIVEAMLLDRWQSGSTKEFAVARGLTLYRARVYAAEAARHVRLLQSWPVTIK